MNYKRFASKRKRTSADEIFNSIPLRKEFQKNSAARMNINFAVLVAWIIVPEFSMISAVPNILGD